MFLVHEEEGLGERVLELVELRPKLRRPDRQLVDINEGFALPPPVERALELVEPIDLRRGAHSEHALDEPVEENAFAGAEVS